MVKIPETFEFGSVDKMEMEELIIVLKKMYRSLAEGINAKPSIYTRSAGGTPTDGATTDTFASLGDININTSTLNIEMLVEHTDPSTVVWKAI